MGLELFYLPLDKYIQSVILYEVTGDKMNTQKFETLHELIIKGDESQILAEAKKVLNYRDDFTRQGFIEGEMLYLGHFEDYPLILDLESTSAIYIIDNGSEWDWFRDIFQALVQVEKLFNEQQDLIENTPVDPLDYWPH